MTTEEKAKAYDEALEKARARYDKEPTDGYVGYANQILKELFPQLRESEKPLTPFQQCLNLVLRKVYFASVRTKEDVDKFILDIVKNHTSELVELAKKHEYIDCQFHESEDERIIKTLQEYVKNRNWRLNGPTQAEVLDWLEKQKEQKPAEKMGFHKCKTGEVVTEWKKEDIDDKMLSKSKQEWSEEDEKNCNRIIRFLEPHKTFFPTKETKEEMQNWLKNRLKSLRPQYHGDVTMTEAYKMGLEAGKASSWKPSEEQIYSLGDVVKGVGEANVGSIGYNLKDLYEQLKKL